MEISLKGKLERKMERHAAGVSQQTGFPSPATHYREPSINLHQELIGNSDATFFIRVRGNGSSEFNIHDKDVLIVDRSIVPVANALALVVEAGDFKIVRIPTGRLPELTVFWGTITYTIHCCK